MKTPIICARCGKEFAGGGWDEITYHECMKQTRTNADRIRAMSDDEINYLFVLLVEQKFEKLGIKSGQTIYEWLKQEV